MLSRQDRGHLLLVLWIGVRVQEADAEGADPVTADPARDGHRGVLVERPQLSPGVIEPPADGLDQVGRHDSVRLDPEARVAVAVRDRLAGDLEYELEALGRDEAKPADF